VQLIFPALLRREHDPSAPKNRLGPSLAWAWGLVSAVDGVTVNNATRSWSIADGAKKANKDSNSVVNMSTGAKYSTANLLKPLIIIVF